jgi:hypothetical protein
MSDSIKETLMNIIEKIDTLDKKEIIKILKGIILKKDSERENINIELDHNTSCCLPSICLSNCKKCRTNLDVNLNLKPI